MQFQCTSSHASTWKEQAAHTLTLQATLLGHPVLGQIWREDCGGTIFKLSGQLRSSREVELLVHGQSYLMLLMKSVLSHLLIREMQSDAENIICEWEYLTSSKR